MEKRYIEAHELPEDEQVYLKKDWLGWRVVTPPTTLMLKLFGSKRNMFICAIVIILALLFYLGVGEITAQYKDIAFHPCQYCMNCTHSISKFTPQINFTISGGDLNG